MQLTRCNFIKYMQELTQRVGVFGTLKRGNPNYFRLLDKKNGYAKFVCNAYTKDKYPLVIASRANIPFILNQKGIGYKVHVEVFVVDDQMKKFLDKFEHVGTLYDIEDIPLILENGIEEKIPIFMLNTYKGKLLDLNYHESYTSELTANYLRPEERSFTIFDVVKEVKQ